MVILRSRRPNTMAVPTTTGATSERGQREPRLQPGEQDDTAHQCQDLAGELRDLVAQNALQQPDVGREPAGQLARPPLGEEPGRHLEQPREQLPPEPGHRLLAGRAQQVGLDVVEHRLDAEQGHQAEGDAVEQRAVAVDERRVEQVPHGHREGEAREAAEDQRDRGAEQHPRYGRTRARAAPDGPASAGVAGGRRMQSVTGESRLDSSGR